MAEFDSADQISSRLEAPASRTRESAGGSGFELAGRILLAIVALAGAYYFASKGVGLVRHYDSIIRTAYEAKGPPKFPEAGDITVFYTAGKVVVSENREGLYDPDYFIPEVFDTQGWQRGDPYAGSGAWSKFYNPPFFALILSPLSLFGLHTAYLIIIGINIGAGAVLVYLLGRIMQWRQPATLLLALGLFSFTPLYFVFQHAQPSLLLAVVLAASFAFVENGAYRPSALMLIFAGLKPQWLALPTLVLVQRERRSALWLALCGIVVIGVPFLLVGTRGLADYVDIVLDRGSGDISDQQFSSAILSWSGFLRALTGQPQPVLWGFMAAVTLVVFVFVCLHRDWRLSSAASIIATLLVIPHSHPQDWVVVAVAGAIVLGRKSPALSQLGTAACLLGIYFAANDWPNESYAVSIGKHTIYWITPAAAVMLAWFGAVPMVESRLATLRAPSWTRWEIQGLSMPQVRAWQAGGFAFSFGIVLGVAVALALVRTPDLSGLDLGPGPNAGGSQLSSVRPAVDPRFPPAAGLPDVPAQAGSSWTIAGPGSKTEPLNSVLAAPAAAIAEGLGSAAASGSPADAGAAAERSPAPQVGGPNSAAAPSPENSAIASSGGVVDEVESATAADPASGTTGPQIARSEGQALSPTSGVAAVPPLIPPSEGEAIADGSASHTTVEFEGASFKRDVILAISGRIFGATRGFAQAADTGLSVDRRGATESRVVARLGAMTSRLSAGMVDARAVAVLRAKQDAGLALGQSDATAGDSSTLISSVPKQDAVASADVTLRAEAGILARVDAAASAPEVVRGIGRLLTAMSVVGTSQATTTGRTATDGLGDGTTPAAPARVGTSSSDLASTNARLFTIATVLSTRAAALSSGAGALRLQGPTAAARSAIDGARNVVAAVDAFESRSAPLRAASLQANADALRRSRALASFSKKSSGIGAELGGLVDLASSPRRAQLALPQVARSLARTSGQTSAIGRRVGTIADMMAASRAGDSRKAIGGLLAGAKDNVDSVLRLRQSASSGVELERQARFAAAANAAAATSTALAARPTATRTATAVADRTDCEAIRATGPRTPAEASTLATICAPTPVPTLQPTEPPAVVQAPPPPPPPETRPTSAPAPAKCTRVTVVRNPSVVALAEGGFRIDAEVAPSDPAGCSEWPAAFTASATISVNSSNQAYSGTWSCDSGRNATAGVPASTHFAFFCTIGARAGPPGATSFFTIQITALSDSGAAVGTSNQSFPPPAP